MKIKPFALERYFAKYEFSAKYLLSPSDCEPLALKELLSLADDDSKKLWEDLWLGYTESQGNPLLRAEISKLYSNIGEEDLLVAAPEEAIFITMNCLLKAGDHMVVTYPGYQSLYEIAKSLGCEVSNWTPSTQSGTWHFDVQEIPNLVNDKTKMIVLNFPHNPTGVMISQSDLDFIINFAKERNIVIFSDEMYKGLEYNSDTKLSAACDLYDNAISLLGMSKTYSLPGLRIGWLATKNKNFIKEFATFKDYTTICSSAPSEILALIGLRAGDKIIKRNLETIKGNLKVLGDFFDRYKDKFEWLAPQAGSIAFPRLKLPVDINKFCENAVEKAGVMVLPATVYGVDEKFFRVGFGRKNMPEVLEHFEKFITRNKDY